MPPCSSYSEEQNSVQHSSGISVKEKYFSGIPSSELVKLENTGKLTLFLKEGQLPVFLPDISEKSRMENEIEKSSFNTGIETLFLHREKKYQKSIKEYFDVLTDVRTLEGIEYYSHSREKYRTLFAEAYPVKGTDRNDTAEKPVFNENIRNYSFNCYTRDLSFGRNYYRLDYTVSDNYLVMEMTNIDDMRYKIIPAIGKGDLTFYLVIMADGDDLAIYCSGICSHANAGFLEKKIRNSIHSRVEALYDWFIDNISE